MIRNLYLSILLALMSQRAFAHSPIAGLGGFYNGMLHPLLVIEHFLVLLVLALCLRLQSLQKIRIAISAFAGGLLLALPMPVSEWRVESLILFLIAISCGLVMWDRSFPGWAALLLAAVVGCVLGLDSFPGGGSGWLLPAGIILGCMILLFYFTRLGLAMRKPWQNVALRIFCAWGASSAFLVLAIEASEVSLWS